MPTLNITRLECIKRRGSVGMNEIDCYVAVDGGSERFLSGPHHLDNSRHDDVATLDESEDFNESIRIRLKERQGARGGNNDLDLGTHTVDYDEKRNKTYTQPFKARNGNVQFDLCYKLTD